MDLLAESVKDAEFMLQAFRRAEISWNLFAKFAREYDASVVGRGYKIVAEVFSDDEEVRQVAEDLVNRNERIIEQLDAARIGANLLQNETLLERGQAEGLIQTEVNRRMADPDKAVYFPLPSLD